MKVIRQLSTEQKLTLLARIEAGERVAAVARTAGVLRKSLYEWRAAFRAQGAAGLNRKPGRKPGRGSGEPAAAAFGPPDPRPPDDLATAQARIAELERLVGRQQMDLDFFREALRSWDETRRGGDAPTSSPSSKK
jgi:transposase-like protein